MMDERLAQIRLIAMDVDGTLTAGEMILLEGRQIKVFHVHDGLGIRLAMNFGIDVAWVTGNMSESVIERAASLGIERVYQGARFKSDTMRELSAASGVPLSQICFIGDDLNDLPAFEVAGFTFAVADAAQELRDRADVVTKRPGGRGAVREAIEIIIRARGQWNEAVESFLEEMRFEDREQAGPEAVA